MMGWLFDLAFKKNNNGFDPSKYRAKETDDQPPSPSPPTPPTPPAPERKTKYRRPRKPIVEEEDEEVVDLDKEEL